MSKSPYLPDASLLADFIRRKWHERINRREDQGFVLQWFLLCGHASKEWLLNPKPATLRKLAPPGDRIWADPFLWEHGGDFFIFCEEKLHVDPHGHIAVLRLAADGRLAAPSEPVLMKDHHLSYPFLFEHEGSLHMVPEGGSGRSIDVYRCEEFPHVWRRRATLMRDIQYVDATLLEHQAKWWLFVTIKQGLFALNRDLFLFWADTPLAGKWTAHPCNPVVRGLTSARPAGRLFELEGKLFRPSQNCLVRYGHSLRINEILAMDAQRYEERKVTEVRPDWAEGIRANHHIDWRDGMVVMDAQELRPATEMRA